MEFANCSQYSRMFDHRFQQGSHARRLGDETSLGGETQGGGKAYRQAESDFGSVQIYWHPCQYYNFLRLGREGYRKVHTAGTPTSNQVLRLQTRYSDFKPAV